jgi:hypothetical protein
MAVDGKSGIKLPVSARLYIRARALKSPVYCREAELIRAIRYIRAGDMRHRRRAAASESMLV